MRSPTTLLSALLLVVASAPIPAETLDGAVVEDHSGNPLASVELRVLRTGEKQLTADLETTTGGRFHGEDIPPGDYRIEVSKANFVPAVLRLSLRPDTGSLLIRLVRFGAISGSVLDAAGNAIPGSRVSVFTRGPGEGLQPFGNGASVDERGRYRVYGLPPGEYAVAASFGSSGSAGSFVGIRSSAGSGARFYPDNRNPQWFPITGGEDYSNTNFTVIPSALSRISGKVTPAGKNYALALTATDQPYLPVASQRLEGNDGAFSFEGIPAGSYELYASGPVTGYGGLAAILGKDPVYGRIHVDVSGQDVSGLVIPVSAGRSASFVLRAGSSQQEAACPKTATLSLTPVEAMGIMVNRSVEVSFAKPGTVAELPPGHYQIASAPLGDGCYIRGAVVEVGAGEGEPIPVRVEPAASLRVKLGTTKPADYLVALVAADAPDPTRGVQAAYSDAQGRFSFTGLRPGKYRIAAQPVFSRSMSRGGAPGSARWSAEKMTEIDLPGGALTELDLPVGSGQ